MFDFLKKYVFQDSCIIPEPQQELKLSVRQRALNIFSNIEGLDVMHQGDDATGIRITGEGSHTSNRTTSLC